MLLDLFFIVWLNGIPADFFSKLFELIVMVLNLSEEAAKLEDFEQRLSYFMA
jgi:hypothetical protein